MKKLFSVFAVLLMGAAVMVSCNDDDNNAGGGTNPKAPSTALKPTRWQAKAGPTYTSTPTMRTAA